MTTELAPFPDVEDAVIDLLVDLVDTDDNIGTATPADLQEQLPFIRVTRFGGADDRITDTASIDLDVFGPTRAVGKPLAELARQRMIAAPHVVGSTVIDTVTTLAAPTEVPWGDQQIRRWTASYRVTLRR